MSKISSIAMHIALSVAAFWICLSTVSANSDTWSAVSEDELKQRIETLYSPVDLRYTPEVHKIINTYIKTYRKGSERLLGLTQQYFPTYEYVFNDNGIPTELKYLSVVESGLRPNIVSPVGAVGLWQFMRNTGKAYGLTINSTVDERRDMWRSTEAASMYLKDLYEEFGDWTLVLAAYNCGPGKLNRVLKKTAGEEFWKIKGYLPKETRRYVPKYVAISYMMSYSDIHGLTPEVDFTRESVATCKVYDYTKLKEISKLTGVEYKVVRELNPAFLKGYIPKNSKGYHLTLPESVMYELLAQNGNWENLIQSPHLSASEKSKYFLRGNMKQMWESLVAVETLTTINPVTSTQSPLVDKAPPTSRFSPKEYAFVTRSEKYHKLRAQQSIADIADLYGLTLRQLVSLNDIDLSSPPAPGSSIRVE